MNGLQSLTQWKGYFNNPTGGKLGLLNAIQVRSYSSCVLTWLMPCRTLGPSQPTPSLRTCLTALVVVRPSSLEQPSCVSRRPSKPLRNLSACSLVPGKQYFRGKCPALSDHNCYRSFLIGFGLTFAGVYLMTTSKNIPSDNFLYSQCCPHVGHRALLSPLPCPSYFHLQFSLVFWCHHVRSFYTTSIWILTSYFNSAAWTTFGTFKIGSTWAWRVPSVLQGLPSVLQVALIWFCPESPRFLVSKGREAEALKVLAYYHADGNR
jgi:hypothetical protein